MIPAGIRKTCLEKVYNSKITSNTETGYHEFFTQSDLISKKYIIIDELSEKNIRLTIDYPEDLELAKKIFQGLGDYFHYYDILELIKKNPMLLKITQKITTWHEGMFKYLTLKSKTSVFFTWLLVFICLYEIFEHIIIPLALIWWGLS